MFFVSSCSFLIEICSSEAEFTQEETSLLVGLQLDEDQEKKLILQQLWIFLSLWKIKFVEQKERYRFPISCMIMNTGVSGILVSRLLW